MYLSRGAVLLGSDDISDYPLMDTRIEGQSVNYFPALINVDSIDGFTMFGEGTVDGNGLRAWKSFWLRRSWNPDCTNKDEQRPRLVFVSNSSNVTVSGLQLQNSHFWTCHIYKSHHVKFLNCSIYAPRRPVGAPSSDAIDIDACHDVLVKGCRMEVNDDSVVLKGGKGPWANQDSENGINERIIVEDCEMYYCHGALTCGSESIHNKNIIMQRIKIDSLCNMLWLKMRPDTPQKYEHILIKDVCGSVQSFINIKPWTQFFDLKGREDIPLSHTDSITLCKCDVECETFLDVLPKKDQYMLSNIRIEDSNIIAQKYGLEDSNQEGFILKDVSIEICNIIKIKL